MAEGDVALVEAELEQLKAALGDSYQPFSEDLVLDEYEYMPPSAAAAAGAEVIAPVGSGRDPLEAARGAVQANLTLQARLKRMLVSVARAQDKNADVRQLARAAQARRQQAAAAPTSQPAGSREQAEYTGVSWFWSLPDTSLPPAYPDGSDVVQVTRHLPLVFSRTPWSDEERRTLCAGVLAFVQERQLNEVLGEMEARLGASRCITLEDFEERQAPIKALPADSPQVGAAAAAFSAADWAAVAHRSVPGRSSVDCKLQWLNSARPGLKRDAFSPEEDEELEELVARHGDRAWAAAAAELGGGGSRTPLACMARHQQLLQSRRAAREFTEADLLRLNGAVRAHGQAWKRVAEEFGGGWDGAQLMHHWRRHQQRHEGGAVAPRKGKWSAEEDELLHRGVALYERKWCKVATTVPGRTDVQCRERYMNVLAPEVRNRGTFSAEEDTLLLLLVPQHTEANGAIKWSAIARELPGRTDRQIAKRWALLTKVEPVAALPSAASGEGAEAGLASVVDGEDGGTQPARLTVKRKHRKKPALPAAAASAQAAATEEQAAPVAAEQAEPSGAAMESVRPSKKQRGGVLASDVAELPGGDGYVVSSTVEPAVQLVAPTGYSRSGRKVRQPARLAWPA